MSVHDGIPNHGDRNLPHQLELHTNRVGVQPSESTHLQTGVLMRREPSGTTAVTKDLSAVASIARVGKDNLSEVAVTIDDDQYPKEFSRQNQHDNGILEVFVLQMFGVETKWHKYLMHRYSEQLRTAGIQLAVLRDVSNSGKSMTGTDLSRSLLEIEAVYASGTALVRHWRNDSVHICEVAWSGARETFPEAVHRIEAVSRTSNLGNPMDSHQYHGPFQVLWWDHCAQHAVKRKPDRVWFAEADAFFTGNVQDFLQSFWLEHADLLAGGFRIAGPKWWQWNKFGDDLPRKFSKITTKSRVVTNLYLLPTLAQGQCNNVGCDDTGGVLFREDHVERVSARILDKQSEDLLHNTMVLPSEVWAPTVCATQLEGCTAYDFAPLLGSLSDGKSWASPAYCWAGDGWKAAERCEGCKFHSAWADKWIHPVKTDVWAAVDCKCAE